MKLKKILFGLLSVALIVVAVMVSAAIIKNKPAPKKDNKMQNIMYVKAEKVAYSIKEHNMKYRGRVTAFDNISLSSEVQVRKN